jgi:hypothetical protein
VLAAAGYSSEVSGIVQASTRRLRFTRGAGVLPRAADTALVAAPTANWLDDISHCRLTSNDAISSLVLILTKHRNQDAAAGSGV